MVCSLPPLAAPPHCPRPRPHRCPPRILAVSLRVLAGGVAGEAATSVAAHTTAVCAQGARARGCLNCDELGCDVRWCGRLWHRFAVAG